MNEHLGGHANITHVDAGALTSLDNLIGIKSMIDVGCGPGGQVEVARRLGIEAIGIDGDPMLAADIEHDFCCGPYDTDERFDLAWSVEFLEHVCEPFQDNYMQLFKRCRSVFCTAAPPGKRGHHHVNCRPVDYWIKVFEGYGFWFDEWGTEIVKGRSTMKREFVKQTGMLFIASKPGGD